VDVTPTPFTAEQFLDLERQQAMADKRAGPRSEKQQEAHAKLQEKNRERNAERAAAKEAAGGGAAEPSVAKGGASLTKKSLHQMMEMVSAGLAMGERTRPYALEPVEIDMLTDAWYEVIRLYPGVGGYFAVGNKLTAWGQALMLTTMVLDRKVKYAQSLQAQMGAGPAHSNSGTERNGQNYAPAPAVGYTPVFDPSGQ
jgi:hypothetical protein